MGEALHEVFELSAKKGEHSEQLFNRVRTAGSKCRKRGVIFPSEALSYLTLRAVGVLEEENSAAEQIKGNVFSLSQGSWDFEKIKKAVLKLYAKKLPEIPKQGTKRQFLVADEADAIVTTTKDAIAAAKVILTTPDVLKAAFKSFVYMGTSPEDRKKPKMQRFHHGGI